MLDLFSTKIYNQIHMSTYRGEGGLDMKKKVKVTTIIGVLILILLTAIIAIVGYRVVVTADELPGKLGCMAVAAENERYYGATCKTQKVSYTTMKFGYMEDVLIAQMNALDKQYEGERLEEIRAINNLTAMSEKTTDKLAYEEAKRELDAKAERARQAAALAQAAKEARVAALLAEMRAQADGSTTGFQDIDTGDSSDKGSGDTKSKGGKKGKPVYAETHGKSLGKFVITAYCTCRVCCGVYSGGNRTASGTVPTSNRTIAVDTDVIPFKTKVVINGQVYVAEDRGSAIKGNRIDMFFMTHKEALKWGRRTMEVYLYK